MTISIACAACRAPNERGARFCRRCGTPLVQDVALPPVAIACPTCGQPVTGAQKFCRGCGHPLAVVTPGSQGAARSEPASAPAAQVTADAPPVPSRMLPSEPPVSATHRMPPRQPELPVRSSLKSSAPQIRRRKIWPWAVGSGLLAAVGIAGVLVYMGKLPLPPYMQNMAQKHVPAYDSENQASVYEPEIKLGNSWTYEETYTMSGGYAGVSGYDAGVCNITNTVKAISGEHVTVIPTSDCGSGDQYVYDRKMNLVENKMSNGFTRVYNPPLSRYDFPLFPGKTWEATSTYGLKEKGGALYRITTTGTVLGWERNIGHLDGVLVDGLKLRIETKEVAIDYNSVDIAVNMEWYVPAAGRSVVIRTVERRPSDGGRAERTHVLTNFVPATSTIME